MLIKRAMAALILLLVVVAGLPARPALAVTEPARLQIYNITHSYELVCDASGQGGLQNQCQGFYPIPGDQYRFDVHAYGGGALNYLQSLVLDDASSGSTTWTSVSATRGYSGGSAPNCTLTTTGAISYLCWSTTENISFLQVTATAGTNPAMSGSTAYARVCDDCANYSNYIIFSPYVKLAIVTSMVTCDYPYTPVTDFTFDNRYIMDEGTCYNLTIKSNDPGTNLDRIYAYISNEFDEADMTWTCYYGTATWSQPYQEQEDGNCDGATGGRQVTRIEVEFADTSVGGGLAFADIYMEEASYISEVFFGYNIEP